MFVKLQLVQVIRDCGVLVAVPQLSINVHAIEQVQYRFHGAYIRARIQVLERRLGLGNSDMRCRLDDKLVSAPMISGKLKER